MEYRVLGSLEVRSNGGSVALGPPKQRAMLAILLLHAGQIVPTDRLIELLWGDRSPRTAAHSIQIYVSELRKALEPDGASPVIVTRAPGYLLEVDPDEIDARRFENLVDAGTRGPESADPAAAANALRQALGLWTGPPFSDFTYEEFAQDEIRRLEELRLDALESLAAAELALGRAPTALAAIESAIGIDPLRERSRELQLLALYRSGRQAEALRVYEQFRLLLSDELGIEPSPPLRRLQERVLIHDPSLVPVASAGLVAAVSPIRNPYKGLRPFGEDDAHDFFGREALVTQLVTAVADGVRLISLVGPSGSGKSSVLNAGMVPALRRGEGAGPDVWAAARMMPGQHPFEALAAALAQAIPDADGFDETLEGDAGLLRAAGQRLPEGRRLLLVIDQLEELFSFSDEPVRLRFLRDLTAAVTDPDGRVVVVLAIRADFYDRPLLVPGFASVFTPGVVNVVPMTADALKSAVVRPAQGVGLEVHPALLAQLTADTADQPGALPMLEYTLTELFDRRADNALGLEAYQALGGLHGVVSRRAEEVYGGLSDDRQQAARQVFLRLVRAGDGARHSRRRVPLRELSGLELDPVALSDVLDEFGRSRLLAFDRDPGTGDATVEVAHEALLGEWERLASWIETHRADLRRQASLAVAADEWEASDRNPDYLLIGQRLDEYVAWSRRTALRLTARERGFLDAGVARRRTEEAAEAERRERQRRLERRARLRLWGLLGTIAVLAGAATFGVLSWLGSGPPDVALLIEGTGDAGFGDMAKEGLDRAVAEFGLDAETRFAKNLSLEVETELRRLSEAGVPLVVVGIGSLTEQPTVAVATDHPGTRYVGWEFSGPGLPDNVLNLTFRSAEGAYLAGAAAALTSKTHVVGFIGAWPHPIIDEYLAGYEAGVHAVDPGIKVQPVYLAPAGDFGALDSQTLGTEQAVRLYAQGADVILAVAGRSGLGVFQAAATAPHAEGKKLWAIGVDTDEYETVLKVQAPEGQDPTAWQPHILTSVTKRLDRAFYAVLADYARGSLAMGSRSFGLEEDGIELSYTGGFLDDVRPRLDALRRQIIRGEIAVPTVPSGAAAQAP